MPDLVVHAACLFLGLVIGLGFALLVRWSLAHRLDDGHLESQIASLRELLALMEEERDQAFDAIEARVGAYRELAEIEGGR